jgi:hypothetical protein
MFKTLILITIFCLSIIFRSNFVYAQDISPADSSSGSSNIDYTLPYPGLLPDHPFYIFKAIRDKLQGLLISNPLKKAEFDLLQADKRLEASYLLLTTEKNKSDLSLSTLSKANNYFEDAIEKAIDAKKQGTDNHDFLKKLSLATILYQQRIQDMENQAGKTDKQKYAKERERVMNFEKRVKELLAT